MARTLAPRFSDARLQVGSTELPGPKVSTHGFLQPRPWQLRRKRSWRAT